MYCLIKQINLIAKIFVEMEKQRLISEMKNYPMKFHREIMYEILSTQIFTKDELVNDYKILTEEAYEQILKYPTFSSGIVNPPLHLTDEEIIDKLDKRSSNEIDVLSLGLPGSGGKTCLLASLMSQMDIRDDFVSNGFNKYAKYLADIINRRALPGATVNNYLYDIRTRLFIDKKNYQDLIFWEFAGEQVLSIAAYENEFVTDIFPALNLLFSSPNKKIILFSIDLTNKYQYCFDNLLVNQQYIFECITSFLLKDKKISKNVISIYIIITKADCFNSYNWLKWLTDSGYYSFIENLKELCYKNKIMAYNNYNPHIIPFSIGTFMPGDTYKYDESYTLSLLEQIKTDLKLFKKQNNIINKLKSFFINN